MALQASDAHVVQIRKEVWNNLYDKDELISPTLPYKLIPIFKGIDAATEKLLEMDVIKQSDKVLLSMEKLLKDARFRILEEKSVMYVTTYKSPFSTVCRVDAPEKSPTKYTLRKCSNLLLRDRIHSISAGEQKFDVLVVSSAAVSKSGQRACKDEVLGELEFAILSSLGYVTQDTLVVTLVHDFQVFDKLPDQKSLQDLPVDYIVTPTQVIKCPKQSKNTEIVWSSLDEAQLEKLYVLKSIRFNQWKEGKDVRFNGETENPTSLEEVVVKETDRPGGRRQSGGRKISYSDKKGDQKKPERRRNTSTKENGSGPDENQQGGRRQGGGGGGGGGGYNNRRGPRRFFGRQRRRGFNSYRGGGGGGGGGGENFKPAVYIGELPRDWTADEFNDFLAKKDVKATSVVKRSEMTHAFAIFDNIDDVNSCLSHLEGLSLEDKPLKVEMSRQTARVQKNIKNSSAGGDHPKENGV